MNEQSPAGRAVPLEPLVGLLRRYREESWDDLYLNVNAIRLYGIAADEIERLEHERVQLWNMNRELQGALDVQKAVCESLRGSLPNAGLSGGEAVRLKP